MDELGRSLEPGFCFLFKRLQHDFVDRGRNRRPQRRGRPRQIVKHLLLQRQEWAGEGPLADKKLVEDDAGGVEV